MKDSISAKSNFEFKLIIFHGRGFQNVIKIDIKVVVVVVVAGISLWLPLQGMSKSSLSPSPPPLPLAALCSAPSAGDMAKVMTKRSGLSFSY